MLTGRYLDAAIAELLGWTAIHWQGTDQIFGTPPGTSFRTTSIPCFSTTPEGYGAVERLLPTPGSREAYTTALNALLNESPERSYTTELEPHLVATLTQQCQAVLKAIGAERAIDRVLRSIGDRLARPSMTPSPLASSQSANR